MNADQTRILNENLREGSKGIRDTTFGISTLSPTDAEMGWQGREVMKRMPPGAVLAVVKDGESYIAKAKSAQSVGGLIASGDPEKTLPAALLSLSRNLGESSEATRYTADELNKHLEGDGAVQVTTMTKSRLYKKQHAGAFFEKNGNLYVKAGRSDHQLSQGPMLLVGIRLGRRPTTEAAVVGKLNTALKSKISTELSRAGLDGNKGYVKPGHGLNDASAVLEKHGIELADVGSLFPEHEGRRTFHLAWSNPDDPFSPSDIPNSLLAFSWYKRESGNFECLAYLS